MKTTSITMQTSLFMCVALAIAGCSGSTGGDESGNVAPTASVEAMAPAPDLATLLASEFRPAADRERDEGRKPADVIAFLGIEPGMNVIDIYAATGYYTEVLSLAVGPDGHVASQNPAMLLQMRDGAIGTALDERLDGRLLNVSRLDKELADLSASDGPFDAAITALNLHDIHNSGGDDAGIGAMKVIYATLKPGGVFGVIDHDGAAGNDNNKLHRMQKSDAIRLSEAAGFVVDGDSGLLHNHNDDMTQHVFAEGMRGNTNRFLLRLRKPAE